MFYTYVLQSRKDSKLYIGHAEDVSKRLEYHNKGKVKSTKLRAPFDLLYKVSFETRSLARWQERQWKTASGHRQLYKLIKFIPK